MSLVGQFSLCLGVVLFISTSLVGAAPDKNDTAGDKRKAAEDEPFSRFQVVPANQTNSAADQEDNAQAQGKPTEELSQRTTGCLWHGSPFLGYFNHGATSVVRNHGKLVEAWGPNMRPQPLRVCQGICTRRS